METTRLVQLPRDGAGYHCTFTDNGHRCNVSTVHGVTEEDLRAALEQWRAEGRLRRSSMRAVCTRHGYLIVKSAERYLSGKK